MEEQLKDNEFVEIQNLIMEFILTSIIVLIRCPKIN
ncbi:hypothetical protein SAMN05444407_10342 [Chryseobacterium contaminans]|uniref:Uncharacterized protein n=1 Tax=Chryseobacterium contaminans TaxID=1423959 RepID=A0A1M6Z168_9FLAO|nr:hypothetical protein SAMN05444407_10342 [Chryseobacterium contaminans]